MNPSNRISLRSNSTNAVTANLGVTEICLELKLRVLFFLRNILVLLLIFSCISVRYERFCIDPLTVYLRYPLDYPESDNIPFDSNFKFLKNKEALTVQHTGRGYSVERVVV